MKIKLGIVQALLTELATYGATATEVTLPGFVAWLHQRLSPPPELPAPASPQVPAFLTRLPPVAQLGPLVYRVQYFSVTYAQRLLADLPLGDFREYIVLINFHGTGAPTRTEIATNSLLELSTITKVTHRMVRAGLLAEVPDPTDRRARRLQLTAAGEQVLVEARQRLLQLAPHIYEPLTPAERLELWRLLSLVNAHHTDQLPSRPSA